MTKHIKTFEAAAKSFKGGATTVKKQMQIMLQEAQAHLLETMQNGKGGDASLFTRALYLAREAKVVRSNIIPAYVETFGNVRFDDSEKRKTEQYPKGQFVPNHGKVVEGVAGMESNPWYEWAKPEADPKPLDLDKRLITLAKAIKAHTEKPVDGDNINTELAAQILAMVPADKLASA